MGTDMTLFVEKRAGRSWLPVPEPIVNPASGRLEPVDAFDVGRPYQLFTLLMGRPAGLNMDLIEIPRIFGARGFPEDMNPLYRDTLPAWCRHDEAEWGASWLALRELVDLDWDQKVREHAYVEPRYVKYFRPDEGFPAAFPNDAKFYNGRVCTPQGACRVTWSVSLRAAVGCEWFIERLSALAPGEELRIIYWFTW